MPRRIRKRRKKRQMNWKASWETRWTRKYQSNAEKLFLAERMTNRNREDSGELRFVVSASFCIQSCLKILSGAGTAVYPQNKLYPQISSAHIIVRASHTLSKKSIMTMPTAIQNMANPHIFFIIHFDSFIDSVRTDKWYYRVSKCCPFF